MNRLDCVRAMALLAPAAFVLPVQAGFSQPEQTVRLSCGQMKTTVTFRADSAIRKAKAHCDCTTVSISGNQLVAHVDTSTFDRNVTKEMDVTTADGRTTRLKMHFVVPPAVTFSSPSLVWRIGAAPQPQVLRISIPKGSPVKDIAEAGITGDDFDYVPRRVKAGREYTVTVTPRSTARRALNRLVIKTDSTDPRFRQYVIYLQVRK